MARISYYPGGMLQPGRSYSAASSYRYGFNGKENDNDVKGEGNQQNYGMRIYDPRLGKFLSVDPLSAYYPYYSPYQFTGNSPIANIDLDGAEPKPSITGKSEGQQEKTTKEITNSRGDWTGTKTETWNWHGGGLKIGQKWNKEKQTIDPILSSAGWYSGDDYLDLLSKSDISKQLAVDAGYSRWVDPEAGAKDNLSKFVGDGLSNNAANFLNAAAWKVGSKANFNASGYCEPSSFNVEDMLGIGLLAKAGIKIIGGVAVKNIGLKEGKQLLLQAPEVIHRHHVLPQQFKSWFGKQGIKNIDDYAVQISAQTHLKGVHGNGLGNLPGQWNKKWSEFIKTNPNASPSEIFNQAEGMLKQYGLEHLPYVPYKK